MKVKRGLRNGNLSVMSVDPLCHCDPAEKRSEQSQPLGIEIASGWLALAMTG
jgi:hypothetical protein